MTRPDYDYRAALSSSARLIGLIGDEGAAVTRQPRPRHVSTPAKLNSQGSGFVNVAPVLQKTQNSAQVTCHIPTHDLGTRRTRFVTSSLPRALQSYISLLLPHPCAAATLYNARSNYIWPLELRRIHASSTDDRRVNILLFHRLITLPLPDTQPVQPGILPPSITSLVVPMYYLGSVSFPTVATSLCLV